MKTKLYALSLVFFCFQLLSHAQSWLKATGLGGTMNDVGKTIIKDDQQNTIIGGSFEGTIKLDPSTTLESLGNSDAFVARYSSSGNLTWHYHPGGEGLGTAEDVAVGKSGEMVVTGTFSGWTIFYDVKVFSKGQTDAFITRFDQFGGLLWSKTIGGKGSDNGYRTLLRDNGDAIVAGTFSDTLYIEDTAIVSAGMSDIFMLCYDTGGKLKWISRQGGTGQDNIGDLASDLEGNIYMASFFSGQTSYGNRMLNSKGENDMVFSAYSPSGNPSWVRHEGSSSNDFALALAVDSHQDIIVTGRYSSLLTIASHSVNSRGNTDMFLLKLTMDGEVKWLKSAGGTEGDYGQAIGIDARDQIYVTGQFLSEAMFENSTLTSNGNFHDIFLASYSPDGSLTGIRSAGGEFVDIGYGMYTDVQGNCSLTGYFMLQFNAGNLSLSTNGSSDVLWAEFGSRKPFIADFSPVSGPAGTMVSIKGTNFRNIASVWTGNTRVTEFFVNSTTEMLLAVPEGTQTGEIRIITTDSDTAVSFVPFKINELPEITLLPDLSVCRGTNSDTIRFQVYDAETPENGLSVSFTSFDPDIISEQFLSTGGKGSDRYVLVRAAGLDPGTAELLIKVTDQDGGESLMPFFFTILSNTKPVLDETGSILSLCEGQSVSLSVEGEFLGYEWTNGDYEKQILISSSGSFAARVYQEDGCYSEFSDTVEVIFHPYPSKPIIFPAEGDSITVSEHALTYNWYLDGIKIALAEKTIKAETGVYTVEAVNGSCMSQLSEEYTNVITGMAEPAGAGIKVYPNPVSENLYIRLPAEGKYRGRLIDPSGTTVLELAGTDEEINTQSLAAGIYQLVLTDGETVFTKRIIRK